MKLKGNFNENNIMKGVGKAIISGKEKTCLSYKRLNQVYAEVIVRGKERKFVSEVIKKENFKEYNLCDHLAKEHIGECIYICTNCGEIV